MPFRNSTLTLLIISIFFLGPDAFAQTWDIDPAHSSAQFKIRHMMITNVTGEFSGLKGSLVFDEKDITKLKAEATIEANTINTNNAKRDEHLKSAEFFDVTKYKTISFKSKKVTKQSDDKFQMVGDLTMHGVTKEVTLDMDKITDAVKDPWGNTRRGLTGTTKLNRKDYNLVWNKSMDGGGVVLADNVDVTLNLELIASAPSKPKEPKKG